MPTEDYQRSVNKWAARAVPAVILAVTGYSVYVVVELVSVQYLLNPVGNAYTGVSERAGIAVPFLVVFFLLLLLWLLCYLRMLQTVVIEPGFIPEGQGAHKATREEDEVEKRQTSLLACAPTVQQDMQTAPVLDRAAVLHGTVPPPPGIEYFYKKDVFICDHLGLPIYCDICNCWKPDRTHHCSEVERCCRRFDHFCPWVGGTVSETNIKFFLQFLLYATVWSVYTGSFMIWAIVDRRNKSDDSKVISGNPAFGKIDGQWIAVVGIAAFLGVLIAGGMMVTTWLNALKNQTTNEAMFSRSYNIAVRLPERTPATFRSNINVVKYPLHSRSAGYTSFAILQSTPSDNIWRQSTIQNLKSVLGDHYLDWILPFRQPPCAFHRDSRSDFPLGPDFARICREAGL